MQRVVIWVRLPGLSIEFWQSDLLMGIASEARKLVALDDFTKYQNIDFARMRVELDSSEPFKLGVLIRGQNGVLW